MKVALAACLHAWQHSPVPLVRFAVVGRSWDSGYCPLLAPCLSGLQIMQYTTVVECRKVAVHCHAGLGRTGLAIACFLLASGQASTATAAVDMVRAARPGSLQTQAQVMFVSIFEQYLQHLRWALWVWETTMRAFSCVVWQGPAGQSCQDCMHMRSRDGSCQTRQSNQYALRPLFKNESCCTDQLLAGQQCDDHQHPQLPAGASSAACIINMAS